MVNKNRYIEPGGYSGQKLTKRILQVNKEVLNQGVSAHTCKFSTHAYGDWFRCSYKSGKLKKWDCPWKCKRYRLDEAYGRNNE